MRRREFIVLVCGAAALSPFPALAQQSNTMRRIGVIVGYPEGDPQGQVNVLALRQRLESLGWVDGRNIGIDLRWAGGDPEKARAFAKEMIGTAPSVIMTSTNQVTEIVRQETRTIPIVFASLGDPVGSGLVASLARPGGNVIGFPVFVEAMGSKWLELLKEIAPDTDRVGFIFHPDARPHIGLLGAAQAAAPAINLKLVPLPVHNAAEIEAAVTAIAAGGGGGGLVVASHAVTYSNRDLLIGQATRHRLPSIFGDLTFTASGGLLSYGSDIADLVRGAATYVDLILKGAKPAELPVQMPTKFDLIVNMKTAKALGLTVPASLLVRATKVIE